MECAQIIANGSVAVNNVAATSAGKRFAVQSFARG
jgi:hypothetical protein